MKKTKKERRPNVDYRNLYGATLIEIASRFGVTKQRISQLHFVGKLAALVETGVWPERKESQCKYRRKYGMSIQEIANKHRAKPAEISVLEKFGFLEMLLKEKK